MFYASQCLKKEINMHAVHLICQSQLSECSAYLSAGNFELLCTVVILAAALAHPAWRSVEGQPGNLGRMPAAQGQFPSENFDISFGPGSCHESPRVTQTFVRG